MSPIPYDSVALGPPWSEKHPVLVQAAIGIRLHRGQGFQQLPVHHAVEMVNRMGHREMAEARHFVARSRLAPFAVPSLNDETLRALLCSQLRAGHLVVVRESARASADEDDSDVKQRRLVREVEAKSRGRLSHQGRHYRLIRGSTMRSLRQRDVYEVVGQREGVAVLRGLAAQGSNKELSDLLNQAAEMLAKDWRPPFEPDGLVLLRGIVVYDPYKPDLGPALTPSQLKQLGPSDWIEIELVDQDDQPYSTGYQLTLTDASVREGTFGEDGFVGVYEIASGDCKLGLLGKPLPSGAEQEAAAANEPEEAEAQEAEAELSEPEAAALSDLSQVALSDVDVTRHFEVCLVDELGQTVAGVEVQLSRGKETSSATSDADGVASADLAGSGDAAITIPDPAVLTAALKSRWEQVRGKDRTAWVKADADTVVVPYRPAQLASVTAKPDQKLRISYQPYVSVVRLSGAYFDSNKCFLLPTALPYIKQTKEVYDQNGNTKLLVVGHTDASSDPAYNDPLSLERAKAMVAYLRDRVDDWHAWYGASAEKKRWGKGEDKLMIKSSSDFQTKPKGEDPIVWYQKARRYPQTGSLTADQRKALIKEYMSQDETTLPESVAPVAHGCGENFPVDQLPPDAQASWDRHSTIEDRRVELFFFDAEMGIAPAPTGENSAPASKQYTEWLRRSCENRNLVAQGTARELILLEMHDALFRTKSAVVLPEGEDPTAQQDGHRSLTSVGLVATVLRYNEEHPGKKLLVAGHCDTSGEISFNQGLSEDRAQVALALLAGDRDEFVRLCGKRHDEIDVTQIFDWTTRAYGFSCKPTRLDAIPHDTRYEQFRASYNAWLDAWDAATEPDPRGGPKLAAKGRIDAQIWGAVFDLYEHNLRQELGEDAAGVVELRGKLVWVDANRPALGFSEYFPVDNLGRDNYRSQANRRVEVLFFDEGEEPDLDIAANNPEVTEIYLPARYGRQHLGAMPSAKPWTAAWDDLHAHMGLERRMLLTAPGLSSGTAMSYSIAVVGHEAVWTGAGISGTDAAQLGYSLWQIPKGELFAGELASGEEFPAVEYEFTVEAGGRRKTSVNRVVYADRVFVELTIADAEGVDQLMPDEPYVVASPWGRRQGTTDKDSRLLEERLPPGGISLAVRRRILLHSGPLPSGRGWDDSS